jgi:hypothetical protein
MPRFLIHGGDVTLNGDKHRNGSIVDFDGLPPVGLEPLDEKACRQKLASISPEMLHPHFPQRTMLLACSVGGQLRDAEHAREIVKRWIAEQQREALNAL